MYGLSLSRAATALAVIAGCTSVACSAACDPPAVTVLHEFAFPSWCENLAIRPNGDILVSRLDAPAVYQVDHITGDAVLIASWNASAWAGAMGISEVETDVYYVNLAAQFNTTTFVKTSGVNSIYKINMTTFSQSQDGSVTSNATVTKLVDIPEADYLNGMTTLDDSHVYTVDVYRGVVFIVDICTGEYDLAIDDPLMKFSYVSDPPANLGANGLKIRDSYLYWTNTAAGLVAKIPIDSSGQAIGASSIAATNVPRPDDFVFRSDGTMFVTANQMDTLSIVYPGTTVGVPLVGSNTSTILAGVTAGKFGRTTSDSDRLYLTTSGGLALPINGTITVPGTISYIDTSNC